MPRISVIVPNYNHAQYLRQRIDSILNQTYQDFELILLDDCSTDNSRELLLSYRDNPHVSWIVFNEQNSGSPFAQWNKGIELAKGDWIWIAESDDWADENFLEVMMAESGLHDNVGLMYSKAHFWCDGQDLFEMQTSGSNHIYSGTDFIKQKLLYACVIYNVSMSLFKKEIFYRIDFSLYNKMHLCGDWWFYTLLAEKTNVLEVDRSLTYYRQHNDNTSILAENEGQTFLEGLDVLDYIIRQMKTPSYEYSKSWGRQWYKYQKKFHFTKRTNLLIIKKVFFSHPMILAYYLIYQIKGIKNE